MAAEDPPELPGFYYDREKGKYFKVIKGHQSTGAGYTSEKAAQKDSDLQQHARTALDHGRINQSLGFRHPLHGDLGLHRELGSFEGRRSHALAWAAGLAVRDSYSMYGLPGEAYDELDRFIYDGTISALIAKAGYMTIFPRSDSDAIYSGRIRACWPESISSMSLSPSRVLLVTSFAGGERPSQAFIHFLKQPDEFRESYKRLHGLRLDAVRGENYGSRDHAVELEDPNKAPIQFSMKGGREILASAARPQSSTASFVIATTDGIYFLSCDNENHLSSGPKMTKDPRPRDKCRAVDWLSENVAISGSMGGKIRLWDQRVKDGVDRVAMDHGIAHCRRMTANKIVVAGFSDELKSYDLRYTKLNGSQPYFTYTGYQSRGNFDLGFDVSSDGSMIAAANENASITVFDSGAETGFTLPPHDIKLARSGPIRCLQFIDALCDQLANTELDHERKSKVDGTAHSQALLAGKGDTMEVWHW